MVGASIGSFPLITVAMYRRMSKRNRFRYRVSRHPLTILFGYFTLFSIGMVVAPFRRNPEAHRTAPVVALVHFGILFLVWAGLGFEAMFFLWFLPNFVAMASGGYLFYAQHNFPDIDIRNRVEWDYSHAALRSSSFFEMPSLMHWLTGNIGYHHVHHLNHRIPFYRLPEAMSALPELQSPGRTSWRPSDVWGCLRLKLWDPEHRAMVTFAEAGV
jgi:omega-6 fatty acid desaturase (delta-12 desaturase)